MKDTESTQSDLEILTQLNADYLASDQNGDVQRYGQILAEDFMSSLPDLLLRNKKQFLASLIGTYSAKPEATRKLLKGMRRREHSEWTCTQRGSHHESRSTP